MLNMNRLDKYMWGVFEFDYVVGFYCSPVAKVETEDVETNIGGKGYAKKNPGIQGPFIWIRSHRPSPPHLLKKEIDYAK